MLAFLGKKYPVKKKKAFLFALFPRKLKVWGEEEETEVMEDFVAATAASQTQCCCIPKKQQARNGAVFNGNYIGNEDAEDEEDEETCLNVGRYLECWRRRLWLWLFEEAD